MKLYYSPGACSLAPHIALREAGLDFEPVLAPTKTHRLEDGTDFYTINPRGYVPLLELDDGERLTEVAVLLQYIADQAPGKQLAPAVGTMARWRLLEWLNFISSEIHKGFSPLFNPDMPDEAKQLAKTKLHSRLGWVDGELAGKDYLLGTDFSVADAYLYTVGRWAERVGVDLEPFAAVRAHQARVGERPAVRQALQHEGLG